jgi:hypothetical protein
MDKKPLIGVSILAVVLLVLGSLSTVVGYQSVQTSQQNLIKERIKPKESLFQTIVDIANNKEIQRIILKSQMSGGEFPTSNIPFLTKNQLKQMYFIGLLLSKIISISKMQSLFEKYNRINPVMQKEISAFIEKDATLHREMTQLLYSKCDCDNEKTSSWDFPIICKILGNIGSLCWLLTMYFGGPLFPHLLTYFIMLVCIFLGMTLHCDWIPDRNI